MTVREYINNIVDGSFTKNDVLLYSEQYPDKNDLYWELSVAQTYSREDTEFDRLFFAMEWLRDQYPTLITYPDGGSSKFIYSVDHINHQDKPQIPQNYTQEATEPVHQVNVPASTRKPGRQSKPFRSVIISEDPDATLATMHSLIDGKIGKDVALVIQAAIIKGKIRKPTASQVQSEFGNIGNVSGFNKCMREKCFTDDEMRGMMSHFDEA